MSAMNITRENFEQEIMGSDRPVLLDFWASWCGPCRMVSPIVDEIAGEYPDIRVGKINVDEQPELAGQFGVMSIPSLFYMENGTIVRKTMGAMPKQQILKFIGK
ncbi:MAG: thioredoxin [Sakamotonia sp.]|jgi:thioredoxin 1